MAKRLYDGYKNILEKIRKSENSKNVDSKDGNKYFSLQKKFVFLTYQFNLVEIMGLFILSFFTSMTNYGKI